MRTELENLFVWLLKEAVVTADERKEEQKKFGIYFDDDYDYLQHLQEPGLAVSSEVCCVSQQMGVCQCVCVYVCVCVFRCFCRLSCLARRLKPQRSLVESYQHQVIL